MGTMSVWSKTLWLTLESGNGEMLWQQHYGCHFVSLLMHICGAKFQEHCFNISRDIIYSVFSTF